MIYCYTAVTKAKDTHILFTYTHTHTSYVPRHIPIAFGFFNGGQYRKQDINAKVLISLSHEITKTDSAFKISF